MTAVQTAISMLIVASAPGLGGCDDGRQAGPVRSETRNVESFDSIDMEGAARLEIAVGGPESLLIEGREGAIERVETEVRGDTLYIESKPRDWFSSAGRPRITIRITLPRLDSLRLEGGNDVRLAGFNGGDSRIKVAGAAHIKGRGRLDELTVHMAGAGHADFSKLVATAAKVTVDGIGSVIVHPKDTLDATMNGVGAILYIGSPREVNTRMNGLGTIGRHDPKEADAQADDDDEAPPVDPETLQPEYEDSRREKVRDSTEVI